MLVNCTCIHEQLGDKQNLERQHSLAIKQINDTIRHAGNMSCNPAYNSLMSQPSIPSKV